MRDLLLGRRPKDFDIGTSAHPYQVKKLFRNCWIIGRRFRLAHVKFGTKVIEVATFRRQVAAGRREWSPDGVPAPDPSDAGRRTPHPPRQHVRHARRRRVPPRLHDQRAVLRHRDVLDHRLRRRPRRSARRHRAIDRRSRRAASRRSGADAARGRARGAARLHDRAELLACDPRRIGTRSRRARRRASSRSTTRFCARARRRRPSAAWPRSACSSRCRPSCIAARTIRSGGSLAALDAYRRRFESTPDTLTNAILLGSLLVPLGIALHGGRSEDRALRAAPSEGAAREATGSPGGRAGHGPQAVPQDEAEAPRRRPYRGLASAICRWHVATSSGSVRSSACSDGCGIFRRARAPSARSRTAHLPRSADLARDPRRRAGSGRALEGAGR